MNRAYSILDIKSMDEDERVIEGVASTPSPDRMGDIVEPMGARFSLPMPLLWQHRHDQPVGHVEFAEPGPEGIPFRARVARIEEPGELKSLCDKAWQSVKAQLVRAVSIGFSSIEHAYMKDGGIHFIEYDWLELSLVTIPANAEATIQTVRSIDAELRAASGREQPDHHRPVPAAHARTAPGASGLPVVKLSNREEARSMATKTVAEQIAAFEATRQAKAARMEEIMTAAADAGETLDAEQTEEYDGLEAEVKATDAHLRRLRALEQTKAAQARPVTPASGAQDGGQQRSVTPIVRSSEPQLAPGIEFARLARVKALAKLDGESPRVVARQLYGENSRVFGLLSKAAVAAGTTSNPTWAGALVGDETSIFADFVEYLRPQTILGRFGANGIPALRQVPFRTALIGQTSGGAGYWVGEGKPKPLTKFDFTRTTLDPLKVANIAVVTEETLRDSSPSAEMIVRDQLAAALRERMDIDFIDPDKAVASGVSPASITNGVTPIPSSGNDADAIREDIRAIFAAFIEANNAPTTGVWVMPATTALALSLMVNPLGQPEFPGITMMGGTLSGLPVIVSEYVPRTVSSPADPSDGAIVALVNASDIYLADEGGIMVDMSREASLQMDDAPTTQDATTGAGTSLVSLWQTNAVGFRAERTINWARRRSSAVAMLSQVTWGNQLGAAA